MMEKIVQFNDTDILSILKRYKIISPAELVQDLPMDMFMTRYSVKMQLQNKDKAVVAIKLTISLQRLSLRGSKNQ